MGNFSYLLDKKEYKSFAGACVAAEKSFDVSTISAMMMTRRAMELATKWVYTVDQDLEIPYRDNIASLLTNSDFQDILDPEIPPILNYIRKIGNLASHNNVKINREEAVLALNYLFQYTQWIDYVYGKEFVDRTFDENKVPGSAKTKTTEKPLVVEALLEQTSGDKDKPLEELRKETPEEVKEELTDNRKASNASDEYSFQVDSINEEETRKLIIDIELRLAGWKLNENVESERKVYGMPNKRGIGYVDYVLLGKNGLPLAVVEAKRTMKDPAVGREQARIYGELLEKETGQRPLIFYTNGFETWMIEDEYPPRRVSGFYTQDELQRVVDRRNLREPLEDAAYLIDEGISGRYYQKEAIVNTTEAFSDMRRKALLVMATGTGKTRTAISLVDVLSRKNWVKNVLFLADRNSLVIQAYKAFKDLLPDFTITNLVENKEDPHLSRGVFSTYPTMMNAIDSLKTEDNRMFSVGHFDLIIIDEAHRSIYKKYRAIFDYFDALIVGLTATPREDIEMSTYDFFDLENGVPTYAYDLGEAIEDKYLVPYRTIETQLKIPRDGIKYEDLTEEEKAAFDDAFEDDSDVKDIDSSAINNWLFNKPTIDYVLKELMEKGIRDSSGDGIGKTIIFAKNHRHAEAIKERFDILFPEKGGDYAEVIDYSINYYQNLIDNFSVKENMPRIAISVDMLDTGIDVPEVVNLVFFKKVRSKIKFWQMIGRGTRLCEDLFGPGLDKKEFLIFDYGLNFEFFGANKSPREAKVSKSLTQKIFETKLDIVRELQDLKYQREPYVSIRENMVKQLHSQITELDEDNFQVRMNIKYVLKYKKIEAWEHLGIVEGEELKAALGPLLPPESDDEQARRFDHLMFVIELAYLTDKNAGYAINAVMKSARDLEKVGNVPMVKAAADVIRDVQDAEYWENISLEELEHIRIVLRELIHFIERESQKIYYTDFQDKVLYSKETDTPFTDVNDLRSYREKVEHYIKTNLDNVAVYKLRHNIELTDLDLENLESVLFHELGSKEQYHKDFGDKSIKRLVREIAGMDREAVNEVFSKYLSDESLNSRQIKFLRLIVDYFVKNGYLDKRELQKDPFKSVGGIVELFGNDRAKMMEIVSIIDKINGMDVG